MNKYKEIKKLFNEMQNIKTKVLMRSIYKGKGRPKKSDYEVCKVIDRLEVEAMDMFSMGFNTNYIN